MAGPCSIQPIDKVCVDSVRCLAAALPQAANSGHPGAPMGCAPMAHVLWSYVMKYSPGNFKWWDRDRFVLSNGHGCALLYTMLHLTGYPSFPLAQLRNFRGLNSHAPGHPENHISGIEVTTGPLGQGISQAVGMAIGAHQMTAKYNKPDITLFDNYVYTICGDGCLQEGVASEACSLAGHLKLGRLIVLYDKNGISIDGSTDLSFTENVAMRFEAYGWHVSEVTNGDTDVRRMKEAIDTAKSEKERPSLIVVKTTIGFGSLKEGSEKTHGAPLGADDIKQCREKLGLDSSDMWAVKEEVLQHYCCKGREGDAKYNTWRDDVWGKYKSTYPTEATEIERRFNGELPKNWDKSLPVYPADAKPAATRALSHAALNTIAPLMPELMGGSADLTESNKSDIKGESNFNAANRLGRYIRYGVREHGMAAIVNGLYAYGGFRPYGATFLNFIGYAWGAVRLSALSNFGILHIATHDSIELGEDGPTHQPIELLPLLRATPNLLAVRPCDGTECAAAYKVWLENKTRPTVMALCRSNVPNIAKTSIDGVMKGGYILDDYDSTRLATIGDKGHRIILAGSGSETHICLEAKSLMESCIPTAAVRVVSMPCWELFDEQPDTYRKQVIPPYYDPCGDHGSQTNCYVEAAAKLGWEKYFNVGVGMQSFGLSAPKAAVMEHFGFTKENVVKVVREHLQL